MRNKIIILAFLMGLLSACDNILEKEPYTSIPDKDMFTDVEGAQGALNGIYNSITSYDYYGRLMYAYEAAKGPDFFVTETGNRFHTENGYKESSKISGYANDAWVKIYSTIFLCNKLMANIDIIEGDADEIRRIKGETMAIRGLAYFDLLRLFAYPPIYSCSEGSQYNDKYKWGVPLVLTQEDNKQAAYTPPARSEARECYDQVIDDYKEAIKNLEGILPANGRISYHAVNALLARAYLYLGEWKNAITAGEIAKTRGAIISYSNYTTNYHKSYNSERLFELSFSIADDLGSNSINNLMRRPTIDIPGDPDDGKIADVGIGYAGYGGNVYLRTLLRAENWDDGSYRDVRTYLICNNKTGDETGIRKYIGEGSHSVHNVPVVRLPEVLLTLAEAYAEDNNPTESIKYLNLMTEARSQNGLNL